MVFNIYSISEFQPIHRLSLFIHMAGRRKNPNPVQSESFAPSQPSRVRSQLRTRTSKAKNPPVALDEDSEYIDIDNLSDSDLHLSADIAPIASQMDPVLSIPLSATSTLPTSLSADSQQVRKRAPALDINEFFNRGDKNDATVSTVCRLCL